MSAPAASFKVCLHRTKETVFHRFSGNYTLPEFQTVVSHLWGGIDSSHLSFEYQDEDGDMVRLCCPFEWEEALRLWAEEQPTLEEKLLRPMRLSVRRSSKKQRKIAEKLSQHAIPSTTSNNSATGSSDEDDEKVVTPPAMHSALPSVPKLSLPGGGAGGNAFALPPSVGTQGRTPTAQGGQPSRRESSDPAMMSVVDLLSMLYKCDAAESLYAGHESQFQGVVTRVQEGDEVHLDIDRFALYQNATRQGNAALDAKDYARAEDIFRCALGTYTDNNILEYNLACSLALQTKVDDALAQLSRAVDHGYDNRRHMSRDPDLVALQGLPAFSSLCGLKTHVHSATQPCRSAAPAHPATVISPRPSGLFQAPPAVGAAAPQAAKPVVVPTPAPVVAPIVTTTTAAVPISSHTTTTTVLAPDVQSLLAVFPSLSVTRAEQELRQSGGNLRVAVNKLLSDPQV